MPRHLFQKGEPRPPNAGRKKGSVNKVSATMREAVKEAFDNMGGAEYLQKLAGGTYQERIAFANICARLIPAEIEMDQKITATVNIIVEQIK